ncbi:MAG: IS1595 family transposase [Rhodobacteraceae bacterium]|nr:MAG: IS1595 family transposase [Paracoccaceae bacterium]
MEVNSRKLTEIELDHVHWWSLERRLPVEGVERYFRTDKDRRERFIKVRWPGGPACIKCGSDDLGMVEKRAVFQCKQCRHQFSSTAGSILHRSRVDLAIWFRAAEMIIREVDVGFSEYSRRYRIPSQTLADRLGVDYVAAHRMRKILLADMGRGGAGLMSEVICIVPTEIPAGIVPGSLAHFDWLFAERSPPSTDEDILKILMG